MELVPRSGLSPEQAAKLRELVKAAGEARERATFYAATTSGDQAATAMQQMFEAERQLDNYITSLAGESNGQ